MPPETVAQSKRPTAATMTVTAVDQNLRSMGFVQLPLPEAQLGDIIFGATAVKPITAP
jgi:hypothetical protein